MSADNGRYICYDVLRKIHFCSEFNIRCVRSPVEDNVVHRVSVCKNVGLIEDSTFQNLYMTWIDSMVFPGHFKRSMQFKMHSQLPNSILHVWLSIGYSSNCIVQERTRVSLWLRKIVPSGDNRISLLGTVRVWRIPDFRFRMNRSGDQIRSNWL